MSVTCNLWRRCAEIISELTESDRQLRHVTHNAVTISEAAGKERQRQTGRPTDNN